MKLNNKGMTLVELIVSVALISVVVGFLFKVILDVKYEKDNPGYASDNQINRSEIMKTLQDNLVAIGLSEASLDSDNKGVAFKLYNNSEIYLSISDDNKKLNYTNYKTNDVRTWSIEDDDYKYDEITYEEISDCYVKVNIGIKNSINANQLIDDIEILAKYGSCLEKEYVYLNQAVLANNTLNATTPDFNTVTSDGEYGLYSALDDYGTSYYFRGDVENNYVKLGKSVELQYCPWGDCSVAYFSTMAACKAEIENGAPWDEDDCSGVATSTADAMYWRIVRINGDGTVRLIYDGTEAVSNGESHDTSIGNYNFINNNDVTVVNYTDSLIKEYLEEWYVNNLYNTYDDYIADRIFCNERIEAFRYTNSATTTEHNCEISGDYNDVINCNDTYYACDCGVCSDDEYYGKRFSSLVRFTETASYPRFSCRQESDKLTVTNTNLDYKVGLLTIDEVAYAGGMYLKENTSFYLYSGDSSWTMTAYDDDTQLCGADADMWYLNESGAMAHYDGFVNGTSGIRPVINLKSSVMVKSGNGTINSPYEIILDN